MNKKNSDLKELLPGEVIKKQFLKDYKEYSDLIWNEMTLMMSQLKVLEEFEKFPDCFLDLSGKNFFETIKVSLIESILLRSWKLLSDNDPDVLTITRFRDKIQKQIKKKYLPLLNIELKQIKFEKNIKEIEKKINTVRHTIAHLIINKNLKIIKQELKVSLNEVKFVCCQLNKLFSLLCFGDEKAIELLYLEINYFLDLIVKDSSLFKMPEEKKHLWAFYKKKFSPNKLEILNSYRRKFGLPEVQ